MGNNSKMSESRKGDATGNFLTINTNSDLARIVPSKIITKTWARLEGGTSEG